MPIPRLCITLCVQYDSRLVRPVFQPPLSSSPPAKQDYFAIQSENSCLERGLGGIILTFPRTTKLPLVLPPPSSSCASESWDESLRKYFQEFLQTCFLKRTGRRVGGIHHKERLEADINVFFPRFRESHVNKYWGPKFGRHDSFQLYEFYRTVICWGGIIWTLSIWLEDPDVALKIGV